MMEFQGWATLTATHLCQSMANCTSALLQADITPLGAAASGGHIQLVEKLTSNWHANVNYQDQV